MSTMTVVQAQAKLNEVAERLQGVADGCTNSEMAILMGQQTREYREAVATITAALSAPGVPDGWKVRRLQAARGWHITRPDGTQCKLFDTDDSSAGNCLRAMLAAQPAMEPWILTSERLPEDGASVAFVVRSEGRFDYLNGRVIGGIYRAAKYSGGFGIPGLSLDASAWTPLPPPPANP